MNLKLCPFSGQETLRYLAFDCLVVDGQNVMQRPLDKRYGVSLPHAERYDVYSRPSLTAFADVVLRTICKNATRPPTSGK